MTEQLLGRSINRLEDERFVRGRGCYIADLSVPDALHGVVVRSPHAHARIVAIHVDAALRMQGVAAVLTGFDLAADNIGPLPCAVTNIPMAKPLIVPPYHALAREAVRYVGEPIAFVVAESAETARDAAEAIVVDRCSRSLRWHKQFGREIRRFGRRPKTTSRLNTSAARAAP